MKQLIDILHSGSYSCVIKSGESIHTFTQHGVNDLYELVTQNPVLLDQASIADKIVGKAAASLMIKGNIKEVYTDIISQGAIDILKDTNIKVTYKTAITHITRRDNTDWCPLEKATKHTNNIEEIFNIIETF